MEPLETAALPTRHPAPSWPHGQADAQGLASPQVLCTFSAPSFPNRPTTPGPGGYPVFCLHEIMTEGACILGYKVSCQGHKSSSFMRTGSPPLHCLASQGRLLLLTGCLLPFTPWVQCFLGGQWQPLEDPPLELLGHRHTGGALDLGASNHVPSMFHPILHSN